MSYGDFPEMYLLPKVLVTIFFIFNLVPSHRVAKCHGYGGYIHVKKLESWGKNSGKINTFAKLSIVLGKFEQVI